MTSHSNPRLVLSFAPSYFSTQWINQNCQLALCGCVSVRKRKETVEIGMVTVVIFSFDLSTRMGLPLLVSFHFQCKFSTYFSLVSHLLTLGS